jgi:hypothetical protein
MIHEALDQYVKIIDAIDAVTDDALLRKVAVDKGMAETAATEKQMLAALTKFAESKPPDLSAYQFVLDQAISATQDSMELASEDLKTRSADVAARDAKEQKEREALCAPVNKKTPKRRLNKEGPHTAAGRSRR